MNPMIQASMARVLDDLQAQHAAQEAEMRRRLFTAWLDLFTDDEQLALIEAVSRRPALTLWYDRARGAGEIDLGDPRHAAFLAGLVEAGALEADRVAAIEAGTPPG
jgi:hypothetical protein